MATDVEICSSALLLLGDKPIASFADGTPRASICANTYSLAKADILRKHNWNCATKRVILSPESTPPAFDWKYQFARPNGWLRTIQVGYQGQMLDYAIEGIRIMANTNVLPLVYVANVPEGEWDSLLTMVMVKRMEMDLAYPITKSTSLRDSLKQEFYANGVGVLAQAKTIDGQENPPEDWGDSPFLQVRG
ncbi:hypothetical protein [Hydrogenophaga sp.]|uniref:hypothetical protein n=1 Tax=Hydrogenophaga sp. TaxID=1904254 RepID=UPI003F6F260B